MIATWPLLQMEPTAHNRRTGPPAYKRIGTYLPLFVIMGLAIPALIYLQVMQSIGWAVPSVGMNGALSFSASQSKDVILYASPTTRAYFAGIGGNYDTLLTPWRNYFIARKTPHKELKEPAQLRSLKEGVLILPSAVALSDEERTDIAAFRAKGGAVLSTWAAGSRNGQGEWAGWQFLETLGAKMIGEIPANAEIGNLILNGESPVTHTEASGQRIWMSKTSETLLRFKGERVAARFMDWARITQDERRDEGAVIFTEAIPGASRAVLFAFAESTWESHPLLVYDLIDDSLRWLQREPT
ncbi:MAG: hypothetical protein H7315_03605, partial [Herminiimonas sp.]|nr:hypothetical protein [Herminiimonas sp.]